MMEKSCDLDLEVDEHLPCLITLQFVNALFVCSLFFLLVQTISD